MMKMIKHPILILLLFFISLLVQAKPSHILTRHPFMNNTMPCYIDNTFLDAFEYKGFIRHDKSEVAWLFDQQQGWFQLSVGGKLRQSPLYVIQITPEKIQLKTAEESYCDTTKTYWIYFINHKETTP